MTIKSIHDSLALPASFSVIVPFGHYSLTKWKFGLLKLCVSFSALFFTFPTVCNVYFPFLQVAPSLSS